MGNPIKKLYIHTAPHVSGTFLSGFLAKLLNKPTTLINYQPKTTPGPAFGRESGKHQMLYIYTAIEIQAKKDPQQVRVNSPDYQTVECCLAWQELPSPTGTGNSPFNHRLDFTSVIANPLQDLTG